MLIWSVAGLCLIHAIAVGVSEASDSFSVLVSVSLLDSGTFSVLLQEHPLPAAFSAITHSYLLEPY